MPPGLPQLINLPRAREYMAANNLDGMIASLPHNVYYCSGYYGLLMSALHFDAAFFAVIPARDDAPSALVMPSMELRRLVTQGGTSLDEVFIFTSPLDEEDPISAEGKPYGGWPQAANSTLTNLEQRWTDATSAQAGKVSGNARGALSRAVEAAGLSRGRVVTDDVRIGTWLQEANMTKIECQADVNAFRHVRLVKTAAEINIMRDAARVNESAARTAMSAFREGAEWHEIETIYATAMAAGGGQNRYLMCGAGGPPSGCIRRNEPMFVDALGTLSHYYGDFGRCVVLGEPDSKMQRRHKALCSGFDATKPLLKPGSSFAQIADAAVTAVRENGLPEFVYATPHSVGLEHTDDPRVAGSQQGMNGAVVLEAGMIINIDMPFTEIGWGSVHIEDTVLINDDGFELLTSDDLDIVQV